ncbi:8669_t:CDS:2 [Funneliformis geosporum]|uniref:15083_t:CDS:1 n=1 Tax=Funneliformis geosporum TaxID=1117311 RepID=A0A9W4SRP5_9GLOM|nr:8669_t:CDS:2 [Funneliformis geosporum]CAI2179141.1 15083_t:CDS:2 [Funneliformis geosporum]
MTYKHDNKPSQKFKSKNDYPYPTNCWERIRVSGKRSNILRKEIGVYPDTDGQEEEYSVTDGQEEYSILMDKKNIRY